jgi:protein TonB
MVRDGTELGSLRFSRLETGRLTAALLLSLLAHLGAWGGYEAGVKFGWWQQLHPPAWLHKTEPEKKNPPVMLVAQTAEPSVFVDVSHADTDAPKQTKYYSNKNSHAANPDTTTDSNKPKLNGKQKDMAKTEDVPRLPKLQPTPPPPEPPAEPAPEPKPVEPVHLSSPMNLGDLKLSKPQDNPTSAHLATQTPPAPKRPRTLKEAMAQQPLPGQQMRQDGGVRRHAVWSSLDAKATAFGEYDRKIVEAVTQHWYDLLDSRHFAQDRTGKVILRFKLKYDGSVEEMHTLENTVGELLCYVCSESIQQSAPFEKWPEDMHRMIGANYREITFTFYYY